jgi:hypothetical protein
VAGAVLSLAVRVFKDPGRAGFFAREMETSFRSGNFLLRFAPLPDGDAAPKNIPSASASFQQKR